jgi:hypothetical protein
MYVSALWWAVSIVELAAFFVQTKPPAFSILVVVLDPHVDGSRNARKTVGHDADERAIAEPDDGIEFDGVDERSGLVGP